MATGANVTAVRPGDAVACTGPKYSDYSVLKEALTYKIPEPSAEAAALALSGVFGYTVIHHAADVKPGQTVFVTAGAGAAPCTPPHPLPHYPPRPSPRVHVRYQCQSLALHTSNAPRKTHMCEYSVDARRRGLDHLHTLRQQHRKGHISVLIIWYDNTHDHHSML